MSLGYVPARRRDAMMTKTQATALATAVHHCRPDWDHPGIVAALERARDLGSPTAVAAALFRLAENHEIRTPAMLAEPGRHWTGTTVASRIPPTMCPDHPGERMWDCRPCAAAVAPIPTDFRERIAAARDAGATT